jgi:hypothetical protein
VLYRPAGVGAGAMSMRPRAARLWLVLCLLASAFGALADYPLTIIDLEHRFAEDLVPVLAPLAGADGSISGVNASLLVRASPRALAEIRAALGRLDRPARNLLVEVRRSGSRSASGVGVGVQVDERIGDHGRVRIGEPLPRHGAPGSRAWAGAGSTSRDGSLEQRLRVLDGQEGFIAVGGEHPVGYRERYVGPNGVVTRRGVDYRASGSGFYVRPRVQGEQVSVDIRTAEARLDGRGTLDRSLVQTRVSGRLGEWIDLGQSQSSGSATRRGLLSAGSASGARFDGLQLRVRVAP